LWVLRSPMARLPTTLRLLPSSMLSSLCGFEAGRKSRFYEHIWVDGVLLFRCGLVTLMMDMISEILSTGKHGVEVRRGFET
jgi:hypothetical protein